MHPRWQSDRPGAPSCPTEDRSPSAPGEDLFNRPLPDLETQLTAALEGAAWGVVVAAPEDALWVDWIYRNLNGYPLPISLVDRVTPHGFPRPDCVSIFPDRRDPDYEMNLTQALKDGVYLIVVCSADSTRAGAVDEHIRLFKNAGGEERIIVLVVDGAPTADLGARLRATECDWLPPWLRWRLEAEGFRTADRNEPRVVDARCGYRSLKQVRDSLLTALVDMDAKEFDRLGGCARPVESITVVETPAAIRSPIMTTAVAIPPSESIDRRGSRFTISVAVVLILVAVTFGTLSFMEITADEPPSSMNVSSVSGVLAGHATRSKTPGEVQETPLLPDAPPAPEPSVEGATSPTLEPVIARTSEPAELPVPVTAPAASAPAPAPAVARANVTQVIPASPQAISRIVTVGAPAPAPEPTSAITQSSIPAANTEADAVLLDEVKTLERRGDETMAEKRIEDALDLYHTALLSAQDYAMRKGTNPVARDQVVILMRKLGLLQMQNSSTAEARATYIQARKALLLLKSQNQWSRERAKALDEIESRLLSLPRD